MNAHRLQLLKYRIPDELATATNTAMDGGAIDFRNEINVACEIEKDLIFASLSRHEVYLSPTPEDSRKKSLDVSVYIQ